MPKPTSLPLWATDTNYPAGAEPEAGTPSKVEPLGKLLVAQSYNTRKHRAKGTKTEAVKHVPVHPTLAAMLAHWKLHGWPAMMGRTPEPDDLIVPLPPEHAERRRSRDGEAFRGHDYSGKRWREEDLPALGWCEREHYSMRATFITLALEDGANPDVIRNRVTYTKPQRNAFDAVGDHVHRGREAAAHPQGARRRARAAADRGQRWPTDWCKRWCRPAQASEIRVEAAGIEDAAIGGRRHPTRGVSRR